MYSENYKKIDFFGICYIIFIGDLLMKLIKREGYLNKLINVIGNPNIKVIKFKEKFEITFLLAPDRYKTRSFVARVFLLKNIVIKIKKWAFLFT